ncbi:hypothetical protein ODE01S_21600 [Oceanithermus desulfurans NBRC 100063]|uniref:Uncharacterized protein n=1 Tax=Oceanithermus desulfurans NBRC 100063 TaxID=1227550 RepID=A0A511RPM4_9DEIN|nr:hypothetical protein ODE01S_21600 [Oceanithermus desulfurans NBRC 100063]
MAPWALWAGNGTPSEGLGYHTPKGVSSRVGAGKTLSNNASWYTLLVVRRTPEKLVAPIYGPFFHRSLPPIPRRFVIGVV